MVTRISRRFPSVAVLLLFLALSSTDAFYVRDGGKRASVSTTSSSSSPPKLVATYPEQPNLKASSLFNQEGGGLVGTASPDGRTLLDDMFSSPSSSSSASSSSLLQQQRRIPANLQTVWQDWSPVLAACSLITSNTVGAGCLVMPELAAGPGMATTAAIFGGAYFVNLVSGLLLADVAILQKEQAEINSNSSDVVLMPCSFKELAETTLNSPVAASVISAISIATNGCVYAFAVSRVGLVGSALVGGLVAPQAISIVWAATLVGLLATQSSRNLSQAAAACGTALFVSFGGLLLPGLWSVADPSGTLTAAGTAGDWTASVAHAAPVMLMSMIYQNIVPTVAKLLNYDRTKVATALVVGSFVPLVMYLAWCFACLGGGIDTSMIGSGGSMVGAALMTVFSFSTLAGSSLGTGLSMASEIESFFGFDNKDKKDAVDAQSQQEGSVQMKVDAAASGFGLPSATIAVGLPLAAALTLAGGEGFTEALSVAGSFGSPLLYGAIPVAMAWQQNKQIARRSSSRQPPIQKMVPASSLPILGACSMGFIGQELVQRFTEAIAF